ncbi:YdeI/OmpD-associated family protein [Sphingobacterium sp. BS-2]|uniref:YdeI/OmpD-associated family protein n=1 Tax=Sphingobacterium sp. BS-2 TaxID=3377129 RepID=UPI0038FC407D
MDKRIEQFLAKPGKWQDSFGLLREIVRENSSLEEAYKWNHPCYTVDGKNTLLIHGFKDYCALLFHKGALLKDQEKILVQQTENVQSARQIRFTAIEQIRELRATIKTYIEEAVKIERSGKKVELKKVGEYPVPTEFQRILEADAALNKAFHSLTPGRQKGYLFHFNSARQARTRESRIERYYQQILDGRGLDD